MYALCCVNIQVNIEIHNNNNNNNNKKTSTRKSLQILIMYNNFRCLLVSFPHPLRLCHVNTCPVCLYTLAYSYSLCAIRASCSFFPNAQSEGQNNIETIANRAHTHTHSCTHTQ